jgi:hypothetical protein
VFELPDELCRGLELASGLEILMTVDAIGEDWADKFVASNLLRPPAASLSSLSESGIYWFNLVDVSLL